MRAPAIAVRARGCVMRAISAKRSWLVAIAIAIAVAALVTTAVLTLRNEDAPPTPTPTPTAGKRQPTLPFGVWGDYPEAWGGIYSGGHITVEPDNMLERLRAVREAGMRVVVSMARGSQRDYQASDGTFSMEMWKARLDPFRDVDFSEFLRDGTIVAQLLIDDIDESNWAGKPVTNRQVEEMARYSKKFWPDLMTAVRARPTTLTTPEYGGSGTPYDWRFLDAAWNQYSARMGNPARQMSAEVRAAKQQGLGLVVGLNVLTGGDGSSSQPGPDGYSSDWAMSPAEVVRYGTPLISHPYSCAFLMWSAKYDYSDGNAHLNYRYFRRPEIRQAMRQLRALADRRAAPPCSADQEPARTAAATPQAG
jgi:hypothetical protein